MSTFSWLSFILSFIPSPVSASVSLYFQSFHHGRDLQQPPGKVSLEMIEAINNKVNLDPNTNRLALAQMMGSEEFKIAEKKLKRKLDMRLLAVMWLIFVLNFLDRNNIAAAKVSGISCVGTYLRRVALSNLFSDTSCCKSSTMLISSHIWTSYLYNDDTAPRYALTMSVNSGMAVLGILGALAMRIILQRANKKLDAGQGGVADVMKGESHAEIEGVTEEERILRREGFRYII